MQESKWLRVWVLVAGTLGLVAAIVTLSGAGATAPRTVLLSIAVWQAMAASVAATGVLLGIWVERLRVRPLAIADRAVYLVPIVGGCGLIVGALIVLSFRFDAEIVWLAIAATAVALAGLWASRMPTARRAIGVLVATILLVEVPRELGWINITYERASFSSSISSQRHGSCERRGPVAMSSQLTGNVGSLIATDDPRSAATHADVSGNADAGWFTCMLPLAKPLSYSASIHFEVSGACTGSGDLDIHEAALIWGIKSCRAARVELAIRLRQAIESAINGR